MEADTAVRHQDRPKPRGIARACCRAARRELARASSAPSATKPRSGRNSPLAVVVIPLGLWLGHTGVERALLVAPMLLVLVVELLNSAIEATVDRIGLERHVLAGLAKDIGSAAVLMSFVLLAVVWLLVLLGR